VRRVAPPKEPYQPAHTLFTLNPMLPPILQLGADLVSVFNGQRGGICGVAYVFSTGVGAQRRLWPDL
jgi:hypothetical protein